MNHSQAMSGLHLGLIVFACLIWAYNFIASAFAIQQFPPLQYTTLRFLMVALILLPWLRLPPAGQWPRLLAVAWSIGALHFATAFAALAVAGDVSSVAIVIQLYVPFSTLMAVLMLGERVGWRSASAILIAFLGVLLVGADPTVLDRPFAVVLAILAAFFLALGTVLMRDLKGIGVFNYQAWNALLSLPVVLALSLWFEQGQLPAMADARALHWAAVAYSAVGSSIVGHGIFYWLIQRHPVSQLTPYLLLTPIFAVLLGVTLWGDEPGWRLYAGGTMVLSGVLVITLRARTRNRPPVDPETSAPVA